MAHALKALEAGVPGAVLPEHRTVNVPESIAYKEVAARRADHPDAASMPQASDARIVLVESRSFVRECIARSLEEALSSPLLSFATVEEWSEASVGQATSAVLLSAAGTPRDEPVQRALMALARSPTRIPSVLLCDAEEPHHVAFALECGARGYIPTSTPLHLVAHALRLVIGGGVFVPASSFLAACRGTENESAELRPGNELFTARQAAVIEALRRGKANKIIAYELNMCESTVKVHVRNIMKKLKAKNRTEVAFIANSRSRTAGATWKSGPACARDDDLRSSKQLT